MDAQVTVFDPIVNDKQSQVRGVGRFMQILKENFGKHWIFTNSKQIPTDSILINPFFDFLKPPLTIGRIAKKQAAVIHDLIPLKYPAHFPIGLKGNMNVFLNKLALKNYDTIITVSETVKKDVVQMLGVDEKKVRVVYHCLPKIFYKNDNSQLSTLNSQFCLYVGDATWNKNLVNLAKAIKIINATCLFVGKIFQPPTRELVNSLTNQWQLELKNFYKEVSGDKRFIFPGYVPDDELIKLYQQAALNVLPSRDEGFGFSWLEAASQRCPSVLNDIPVFREIAGDSSVFCNVSRPNDLANTIGELYFNKDNRNALGEEAFQRSRHFLPEQFKSDFSRALDL